MSRPYTGPYGVGAYLAADSRRCDDCHVRVKRTGGAYFKTSALTQVWACDRCLGKRTSRQKACVA